MHLSFSDIDIFLMFSGSEGRTEAAQSLGITPGALCRVIQRVESEFGLVLVVPHSRGVCMTKEGERLLPVLHKLRAGYLEANRTIVALRGKGERSERSFWCHEASAGHGAYI